MIEIFDLVRARDIFIGRLANPENSQLFAGDLDSDGSIGRNDVEKLRDILLLKAVPPPTIFTINPAVANIGEQITIDGAGFDPVAGNNIVKFNNIEATVISATETQLVVNVPQGASTGSVVVTVNQQASNTVNFQLAVSPSAPVITAINPGAALRKQEIKITGQKFGTVRGNSILRFGDVAAEAADIVSWSDIEITAGVPESAFPGRVTVTVNGETSNPFEFNVVVVEATPPDSADIAETEDGIRYVRNEIILDFKDDVGLPEISDFLSQNDLTQVGIIFRPRMIQARFADGRDPFNLANSLAENELLDGALPSFLTEKDRVVSESYNAPILSTYNKSTATFEEIRYHHFAMGTFAGHRLVEAILEDVSEIPDIRVAVIDGGLGDGRSSEQEFGSHITDPTAVGLKVAAPIGIFFSGVTTLDKIADGFDSHGTQVSGAAAAAGTVVLGTGKHINLRPIKTTNSLYLQIGGVEIANSDPNVKVINLSWGILTDPVLEFIYGGGIFGEIGAAGKIVVTSAGNDGIDAGLLFPKVVAPDRPREPHDPAIMVVSATKVEKNNNEVFGVSNFGPKISVSAPGFIAVLERDYTLSVGSGTSFAAPLVSGLAGEMFLVDKVLVQSGKRPTEMTANQIIDIIEATADDLGASGPDDLYGNGRINVWKALLAVANGGLSTKISNPDWYGFEIRSSVKAPTSGLSTALAEGYNQAQIYIDDVPLNDDGNTNTPGGSGIKFNKRVPPKRGPSGELLIPIPNYIAENAQFLSTFSITNDELGLAKTAADKRLQIQKKGKTTSFPPLLDMPLDLAMLKSGIPGIATYSDFVFAIRIPRVVELKAFKNGSEQTVFDVVNGVPIPFPIGVDGDEVEISISFPEFVPTIANTNIAFFDPGGNALNNFTQIENFPGQNITSKIKVPIHDRAKTGPVTIRTSDANGNRWIDISSVSDLIVPRVVGVNPDGLKKDDPVRISIDVPYFNATTSNTKIRFPGGTEDVVPDNITPVNAPNLTHVLVSKIPENLQEGPVKVTITVEDNQKVEFEGGILQLAEKIPYAGNFTVTNFQIDEGGGGGLVNRTPPAGKNVLPLRFTLNKTIAQDNGQSIDVYFLTAPIENTYLAIFGPTFTSELNNDSLNFLIEDAIKVSLELDPGMQKLRGTYNFNLANIFIVEMDIAADKSSMVDGFNGVFAGRPKFESTSGDEIDVEGIEDAIEKQFSFPFGFVQVDDLVALTEVDEQGDSESEIALAKLLQPSRAMRMLKAVNLQSDTYLILSYFVAPASGNMVTYLIDESVLRPDEPDMTEPDSFFRFDFTKGDEQVTGDILIHIERFETDENNMDVLKKSDINLSYLGQQQNEDEDNVNIVAINPTPELGFPGVAGNTVVMKKVNVYYNYASGDVGSIVLRAFKNNDPGMVLAEDMKPIVFATRHSGFVVFEAFSIPNVTQDVTTISIVAGIKPAGATVFIAESPVISYSR